MWLNEQDKRELQYLLYQWRCVLSLCECTSVYPAVPTVTYFGHLLPDRAGTCLWNSTWGADERERLFFFILKNKTPGNERTHAHLTRLVLPSFTLTGVESASWKSVQGICCEASTFLSLRIFLSGWPASTHRNQSVYGNVSVCVCVCLLHSVTCSISFRAAGPCNKKENFPKSQS